MENFLELKKKYNLALEKYPFESEEEALILGIENFILSEKESFTALESPYIMRQEVKKKSSTQHKFDDYLEEVSSSGESSEDSPFYDDIRINADLFVKGKQILDDCELTIMRNHKYGLVGRNGIGKTTFIKALRKRKFGISKGLKIHAIRQDYVSDEKVIDFVGPDGIQSLRGLGFTLDQEEKILRSLSGGWRMRAQLAKAIHLNPDLLLLDEPTNFLDLKAIAFLESKIKDLKTVIIVSHDRQFLDNTVDHIMYMSDMKIEVFNGNFTKFKLLREDKLSRQIKEYQNQMAERAHLQTFIDRFRSNAKRATQAQSKIKLLEKMPILNMPKVDPVIKFKFPCTEIKGLLMELADCAFEYSEGKEIFNSLSLKINHDSRIVIVGDNGQGKSTLLKILAGLHNNTKGTVIKHDNLKVGYFAQHHVDHLDHNEYVLSFMMKDRREDEARAALSKFGLNITNQQIGTLSGGQKSRLAFAQMSYSKPNLLLLDEPTNHLDLETIDALADAINNFEGAVLCVSHDLSFIQQAFKEVYVCENKTLKWFRGTVLDYKEAIKFE